MRKDALKNKQKIENTAIELFNQNGVAQVSMNQISKAAGIGMGTMYRHFKDKSDLCYHIIQHDFDDVMNQMELVKVNNKTSTRQMMSDSLDIFLKFKSDNSQLLNCIEENNDKTEFHHSKFFQNLFNYYYEIFDDKSNSTWVTFKVDMFLKTLATSSFEYQKQNRQLSNETIRDYLLDIFL